MSSSQRYRLRPLIRASRIQGRVRSMGKELSRRFAGQPPLALVVMDGAAFFATDLLRATALPEMSIHFMKAASYHGGITSSGQVELRDCPPCAGAHVLLIDDILDSGHTLQRINQELHSSGAASITSCVLLDKPQGRQVPFVADLVGFTVPNAFLVGYGLDYQGQLRQLPDICTCTPLE